MATDTDFPAPPQSAINGHGGSWNTDDSGRPRWTADTIIADWYHYEKADGSYTYTIIKGKTPNGEKRFKTERLSSVPPQDRFSDDDRDKPGLGAEKPVLYRLPELIAAKGKRVLVPEGEKDVETARALRYAATCNPFGALKWKDEYSKYLTDCDVVVVADNDERGKRHADQVVKSIKRHAQRYRVLHMPDGCKDLTEWVEAKRASGMQDMAIGAALHNLIEATPAKERVKGLGAIDAGTDTVSPPPRGWLLGNTFCRKFVGSLYGDGGVGKTALRYAQALSMALGRKLTDEHVFARSRVLVVSLEDDMDELRRRFTAPILHHNINRADLTGWLFYCAPGGSAGKLMEAGKKGQLVEGELKAKLIEEITENNIDVVIVDPFVKSHAVEENANNQIDMVAQVLADIAAQYNIAVDTPHHVSKGPPDPGNADRGRGASAQKAAFRLIYTLTQMSGDEAKLFGIQEGERKQYVRMDSGKVNITKYLAAEKWFKLVGVKLGNTSPLYPNGDEVQTVVPWEPPDVWAGLTTEIAETILATIDQGLESGDRYTVGNRTTARSAWPVVVAHCPTKSEGQARAIIKGWVANGYLVERDYINAASKTVSGLYRGYPAEEPF